MNYCEIIYFIGTKFRGLTTMETIVDTGICGLQIIFNTCITQVN